MTRHTHAQRCIVTGTDFRRLPSPFQPDASRPKRRNNKPGKKADNAEDGKGAEDAEVEVEEEEEEQIEVDRKPINGTETEVAVL
jgi:hypothetical protein